MKTELQGIDSILAKGEQYLAHGKCLLTCCVVYVHTQSTERDEGTSFKESLRLQGSFRVLGR